MKRMILLVISLAGFGAAAVAGGLAQTANTDTDTVDWQINSTEPEVVCAPEGAFDVELEQVATEVPSSDGETPVYTPVANILVGENDPECDYNLTMLAVTDPGTGSYSNPDECDLDGPSAQAVETDWDFALNPADVANGDTLTAPTPPLPLLVTGGVPADQDSTVDLTLFIEDNDECTVESVSGGEVTGTFEEVAEEPVNEE